MLEQDYLMRLILQFFQAMVKSSEQRDEKNPLAAADTLEAGISQATDLDGAALLSLSPESIASVLQVAGVDPQVVEFVARGMLLESVYLADANDAELSQLRAAQARALAAAYNFELPHDPTDFDDLAKAASAAQAELAAAEFEDIAGSSFSDFAGCPNVDVDQYADARVHAHDDAVWNSGSSGHACRDSNGDARWGVYSSESAAGGVDGNARASTGAASDVDPARSKCEASMIGWNDLDALIANALSDEQD